MGGAAGRDARDGRPARGLARDRRGAVRAAHSQANGSRGGEDCAASLTAIYAGYRARHRAIHAQERRWADEPFWARRQAAGAALIAPPPAVPVA